MAHSTPSKPTSSILLKETGVRFPAPGKPARAARPAPIPATRLCVCQTGQCRRGLQELAGGVAFFVVAGEVQPLRFLFFARAQADGVFDNAGDVRGAHGGGEG